MHIENQIQTIRFAPAHDGVDAHMTVLLSCLTHIVLIGEEFIVEGQTDGVGTLRGNEVDISTGDIVIFELLPELCGEIRAYSLLEEQVDHPGRVGL